MPLLLAIVGAIFGSLLSAAYYLPPDHAPVREAPEWAGTVAPGNEPDHRVDPEYQRRTQLECMRSYQRKRR